MGMSSQQILQSDPEYLRRQMAQQEMQRLNPTGGAAGAIGALLGRGIGNVASGRGFMDTGDAGLRRVSEVQGIMSSVPFDPENPATYYEGVAAALKQSGYGDLAVSALKEAASARTQAKELSLKEREIGTREKAVNTFDSLSLLTKDGRPVTMNKATGALETIDTESKVRRPFDPSKDKLEYKPTGEDPLKAVIAALIGGGLGATAPKAKPSESKKDDKKKPAGPLNPAEYEIKP
jgi:hypothetical protein